MEVDDVILGCANQAGEDNRNVARMSLLLADYSETIPGVTVNRLCGSGMEAVAMAARSIKVGEADLIIAGGVESMSRAPFVMGKASEPFSRNAQLYDTTIGWRFINKKMEEQYGSDSMIETAENLAVEYKISREDQDLFAFRSQTKAQAAQKKGLFIMGIGPVPAAKRILNHLNLKLDDVELIELNEAFASQSLACIRLLGLKDDDPRINPLSGAIALGHPLGMSGARLVTTAVYQMKRNKLKNALCTMCIGVGQGIAMVLERI